ncbi:MAG: AAA family ATPase [Halolamina sp.]
MTDDAVELTVHGAEKRDAGRAIARLPERARKRLSVLSGETVRIEGEDGQATVTTLWPARDDDTGVVRIDADTRENAGVAVGDTVVVTATSVPDADAVAVRAPGGTDSDRVARALDRTLDGRPLSEGDVVRLDGAGPVVVADTDPGGEVQVADDTEFVVRTPDGSDEDAESTAGSGAGGDADAPDARDGREPGSVETATGDADPAPREGVDHVTYEDIGGLDEELDLVRETIELPLSNPDLFARLGVEPPKGVLLHGPPGTGKTLIAKAVANEVDAAFRSVSGPEIMSQYKGQSEERLRQVFEEAREAAPAIVFFDEIDSVAPERDDGGDMENRIVGQLLSLMDGLDARGDVVVVGATNRVDELDPALRRGGRFDREVEIGVPGVAGRREILEVHTRRMPLGEGVDLDDLAERTHGFTGADLASLSKEAGMTALRRVRRDAGESAADGERAADAEGATVTVGDFETALAAVEPSAMREYVAETPETTFADVGGLDDAERRLRRAVTWPLEYGPLFEAAGTDPPTGLVLHGPPGTGKTLLARAVAGEAGVNFVEVAGPELLDRYVGESEKAVREVFERARQAAPAVVFFDEIDAVATDRDGGADSAVGDRVVSQLLTELDRAAADPTLVVLAATNRKAALDPALLRPGRLEDHVEVPAPEESARREILAVHAADTPLSEAVALDDIAAETEGYSGADLQALLREAALLAVEEVADRHGEAAPDHAEEVTVTPDHVERALETVEPSGR